MASHPINRPQEVRSNDHLQNARRDYGRGRTCNRRRRRRNRERRGSARHDEHNQRRRHAECHRTEHVELDTDADAGSEINEIGQPPVPEHGLERKLWIERKLGFGLELHRPAGRWRQRAVIAGRPRRSARRSVGGVRATPPTLKIGATAAEHAVLDGTQRPSIRSDSCNRGA
jgi:hypothetical protein